MTRHLVLRVHLHEPRYHGSPEWPPSPARAYQALVAGAAPRLGDPEVAEAFRWLERQDAPVIGVPNHTPGKAVKFWVPNNDLDAKDGDPERVAEIRTAKMVQPRLLDGAAPVLYAWTFSGPDTPASRIADVAHGLYQLGRSVDMAYAEAAVVGPDELDVLLGEYPGTIHRPTPGAPARGLACPREGTFDSLERRFRAQGERFRVDGKGRSATRVFVQPPKALFREVAYDHAPARYLFELRPDGEVTRFAPVALEEAHTFVVGARDRAVTRLVTGGLDPRLVEGVLIGRRPGEPEHVRQEHRARLVPLPSIGQQHTDPRVRRLLVEVPQGGPLRPEDIRWALSGLDLDGRVLVEATDHRMLDRYLSSATRWQTVTPAALPAARRRIEPSAPTAKDATERQTEEAAAVRAVRQALRHAGVPTRALRIEVRREPYRGQGRRAEVFGAPPRFPKERLWHVEVTFDRQVPGPLVIGDGRYLGLGVMAPAVDQHHTIYSWRVVDGLSPVADPLHIAASLRRAVLARAQATWGEHKSLPAWLTGHRRDGSPAEGHAHLYFAADISRERLFLLVPDRDAGDTRLTAALDGLTELRAGRSGLLRLAPVAIDDHDPLVAPGRVWRSLTPYLVMRHRKVDDAAHAVAIDVRAACRAMDLPEPAVEVLRTRGRPGSGLEADVVLTFAVAIEGPLLLGRSSHRGGGVFVSASCDDR